jgi:hypothetical protein
MTRINLELSEALLTDSNCWHRRFFRCWIGGDYGDAYPFQRSGYEQNQINLDFVTANADKPRKLRMFVISEFTAFMASEFDCSPSTVCRQMVGTFGPKLDALNDLLIEDVLDMFADDLAEVAQ